MIDKLFKTFHQFTDSVKEQASNLGESAKEKSFQLIEEWIKVLQKMNQYGLEVTSFGLGLALSPFLDVELKADPLELTEEKIELIIEENKGSKALVSVFRTLQTTLELHRRAHGEQFNVIIIKLKVKIPPEIRVILGEPILY